jgi:A/G-specific adenine glycosylase
VTWHDQPGALVPREARDAILAWYAENGRQLAFRASADPYAVLVSEVLAQQTQAARAAEAWTSWIARWPGVSDLAAAPVADVLRAWAGLGYNRRALALHRAARVIVDEHGGRVPSSIDALEALPGVGPYTARAVAAIAFGVPVGAVDTNVRRVLGRVASGELGPTAISQREMQRLADAVVPAGAAAAWTHALMDVGATLCRPRNPRCGACPTAPWCRYAAGERTVDAGAPGTQRRSGSARVPFPETRRWLRGRILEQARGAEAGAWVVFAGSIGEHGPTAVREAVAALTDEGLLERRDGEGGPEARLPG